DVCGLEADDVDERGRPRHALVGHERNADRPPNLGQTGDVGPRNRLLDERQRVWLESPDERHCLDAGEALVEIHAQRQAVSDGRADGRDPRDTLVAAPEILIFAVVNPRRSHSPASVAACAGGTVPIHAFSVTSRVSAPPRSEWTGTSSARPFTSRSAISIAAFASKPSATSPSMSSSARWRLKGSAPTSAGASRATTSWTSTADTSE